MYSVLSRIASKPDYIQAIRLTLGVIVFASALLTRLHLNKADSMYVFPRENPLRTKYPKLTSLIDQAIPLTNNSDPAISALLAALSPWHKRLEVGDQAKVQRHLRKADDRYEYLLKAYQKANDEFLEWVVDARTVKSYLRNARTDRSRRRWKDEARYIQQQIDYAKGHRDHLGAQLIELNYGVYEYKPVKLPKRY